MAVFLFIVAIILLIVAGISLFYTAFIWLPALALTCITMLAWFLWKKDALKVASTLGRLGKFAVSGGSIYYTSDAYAMDRYWDARWVTAAFVGIYISFLAVLIPIFYSLSNGQLYHSTGELVYLVFCLLVPSGLAYWIGPFAHDKGLKVLNGEIDRITDSSKFEDLGIKDTHIAIENLRAVDEYWNSSHAIDLQARLKDTLRENATLVFSDRQAFQSRLGEISAEGKRLADSLGVLESVHRPLMEKVAMIEKADSYWHSSHGKRMKDKAEKLLEEAIARPPSDTVLLVAGLKELQGEAEDVWSFLVAITGRHDSFYEAACSLGRTVIAANVLMWMAELEAIQTDLETSHFSEAVENLQTDDVDARLDEVGRRLSALIDNIAGVGQEQHSSDPTAGARSETGNQNLADAWATFNLPSTATYEEAKAVFRELSKIYHPDKKVVSSEEGMKRLNEAWQIIRNHFAASEKTTATQA